MNTLIKYLRISIRFSLIILTMFILLLAIFIIYPFSINFIRSSVRKLWTNALIKSSGAHLTIQGAKINPENLKNTVIIANHISWLDTVVLYRLCFIQFIGKIEMLKWPLLRPVFRAGGTLFIDRKKKRELLKINQYVAHALKNDGVIGFFPEGKTTLGTNVANFKAPLLEAALLAKSTIVPVVLNYQKENGKPALEASFYKIGWVKSVIRTISLKNLYITLTILPPIDSSQFSDRITLSNHLENQVRECFMTNTKISKI